MWEKNTSRDGDFEDALRDVIEARVERLVEERLRQILSRPLGEIAGLRGSVPEVAPQPAPTRSKSQERRLAVQEQPKPKPAAKAPRVTKAPADMDALISTLRAAGGKLSSGELRSSLALAKPAYHKLMESAREAKVVNKSGEKRGTIYSLTARAANGASDAQAN